MFYPLQPLTSAVLGIFFLHEVITWNFVVGGLLICAGVLITVLFTAGKKQQREVTGGVKQKEKLE